jgi:hypothetical protein
MPDESDQALSALRSATALTTPQSPANHEPRTGDLVLLQCKQGVYALCAIVGQHNGTTIVQFLLWEGRRLPSLERLRRLPGLICDGEQLLGQRPLLRWIEPRCRPLYFAVSDRLGPAGRIVGRDEARVTDSWLDSDVQRGRSFCVETTWQALRDYYIGSGALQESFVVTRELTRRRLLHRRSESPEAAGPSQS